MESKMKETLEEAAERIYPISGPNSMWNSLQQDGFIDGAKWQQEQAKKMQQEELEKELNAFFLFIRNNGEHFIGMSIEQFVKSYLKSR
jgi:hypothetical protein